MDTPDQPKKKQSLATLGSILLIGGIMVLRQAANTETFMRNIHEEGEVSWAIGLGWLLILGGGAFLLAGLAKLFASKE